MGQVNFKILHSIDNTQALVEASLVFKRGWQTAYSQIFPAKELANLDAQKWQHSLQQESRHNLLATVKGHVVGVASFGPGRDDQWQKLGELMAVYVLPKYQGQGVGTALLKEAESGLAKMGFTHSYLWVLVQNKSAQAFYQANGWRKGGVEAKRTILHQTVSLVQYRKSIW